MQRMALVKLLREFDVDKNGTVTKEEFRRGVKAVGVRAPLHELNALFNSFDVDLDGTLSHDELLMGLAKAGFVSKYDGTTQEGWKRESSAIYTMEAEDEMNGEGTGDLEVAVDEPFMQAQKQGGAVVQGADAAKANRKATSTSTKTDNWQVLTSTTPSQPNVAVALGMPASAPSGYTSGTPNRKLYRQPTSAQLRSAKTVAKTVAATVQLRAAYQNAARREMDQDRVWAFKTFRLFPVLVRLRKLEHHVRWFYPLAYTVFVHWSLSEVDYGQPHMDKLRATTCFSP